MSLYDSRFFTTADPKVDRLVFDIPAEWWSRLYEYAWASRFADPRDTALDAACGLGHHFKYFLGKACREAHACDHSPTIRIPELLKQGMRKAFGDPVGDLLEREGYYDAVRFRQADITDLPYEDRMFDKVYCLSVLEELGPEKMRQALGQFARVLKDDGLLVLTFDYPLIKIEDIEAAAAPLGLTFAGNVDPVKPDNAIYSDRWKLWCCRAVLKKREQQRL